MERVLGGSVRVMAPRRLGGSRRQRWTSWGRAMGAAPTREEGEGVVEKGRVEGCVG